MQKKFSFFKDTRKVELAEHLEHCERKCEYGGTDCIYYCKKYNIGKVNPAELTKGAGI